MRERFRDIVRMKYPPAQPYHVAETVKNYKLLQIGLTWRDLQEISFEKAEMLLMLYEEIKQKEKDDMDKSTKNIPSVNK